MLLSRGNKWGFYRVLRALFVAIVVLIIDLEEQTRFAKAQSEHQSWMMRNPTLSYFQLNSQSDHTNHSHHGLWLATDDIITTESKTHHQLMTECCSISQSACCLEAPDNMPSRLTVLSFSHPSDNSKTQNLTLTRIQLFEKTRSETHLMTLELDILLNNDSGIFFVLFFIYKST